MGKQRFKVGDWVRSLVNWGDIEVGKIYQIPHLDGDGEPWFTPDGTGGWNDYLTLDEIEPWQPRVGERVRFTDKVPILWFFGPAKEYKDGVIKSLNSEGYRFCVKTGDAIGHVNIEHIEPILTAAAPDKPATLKIEAGRFYKTRDGRKVGPMVQRDGYLYHEGWHYNASGECCYRGRSGDCVQEDREIIAEWIDEPAAKPSNDNAKPKFKVGDRVKCLKSYPGQFTAGKEYVVSADHFGRKYESVKVKIDDAGSTENGWLPEFFELSKPTTTIIVALIENGQPKPSSTPHVHASTGSAEKEAKRLAAKYKGKQFGVFTLTTTHEEAAPVYDHKWQNMAALGLKIDAIKELQTIAGIPQGRAARIVGQFAA